MRLSMKRSIVLCLLLLPLWVAAQKTYTVGSVPNTRLESNNIHVSDPDDILDPEYEALINQALCGIREQSDVFVVCLNSIGSADVTRFSVDLFNTWGIGDAKKDNGLLMLLVMDVKKFRFEVGYGVEPVMTDLVCRSITENTVFPYFRKGLYAEGIYAGVGDVVDMFGGAMPNDSTLTDAQRSNLLAVGGQNKVHDDRSFIRIIWEDWFLNGDGQISGYGILYIIISIALVFFLIKDWRKKMKTTMLTQAAVDKVNKGIKEDIGIAGCLGCGFPVLWLLLPLFFLTRPILRRQRKKCVCGHKMRRLSEAEEDTYLNEEQRFEEDLKVRDYDVWLCEDCGRTAIFYYDMGNAKFYQTCPICNCLAAKKIRTETLVRATYDYGGTIQRTYLCKHCKHEFSKRESTPKLTRPTIVVGGGPLGGGGFGGGFSGGSFGGGHSGGGGYTGSW